MGRVSFKFLFLFGAVLGFSASVFAATDDGKPESPTPPPSKTVCLVVSRESAERALGALSHNDPLSYRREMKSSADRMAKFNSTDPWNAEALNQHISQLEVFSEASLANLEAFLTAVRAGTEARNETAADNHNIRNILVPVKTTLQVIRHKMAESVPKHGNFTPDADLIVMVAKLRNLLDGTMGELKQISLSDLVGSTTKLVHDIAPHGIKIDVSTDIDSTQQITVNDAKIRDILVNFVTNSKDALAQVPSPKLKFSLSFNDVHASDALPKDTYRPDQPLREGRHLVIEIADNAGGMSPELMREIWEGGKTTKGSLGTGLGLRSTREIAKEHGGFMEVESKAGEGTKMRLYLPLENAKGLAVEPAKSAPAAPEVKPVVVEGPRPDVLIIDDNRDASSSLATLLGMVTTAKGNPRSVLTALGSKVGLESITPNKPQVVLLDFHIPGESTPQTIAAIRAINPKAKIFIQSGARQDEVGKEADLKTLGADGWTTKGDSVVDLLKIIEKGLTEP